MDCDEKGRGVRLKEVETLAGMPRLENRETGGAQQSVRLVVTGGRHSALHLGQNVQAHGLSQTTQRGSVQCELSEN